MRSCADVIDFSQIGNFSQVRDSAGVNHGCADIVDQLFLNQRLAIVDGVEHFADRQGRGGVLTDDAKTFLQFCGDGIFKPEQVGRFQFLA